MINGEPARRARSRWPVFLVLALAAATLVTLAREGAFEPSTLLLVEHAQTHAEFEQTAQTEISAHERPIRGMNLSCEWEHPDAARDGDVIAAAVRESLRCDGQVASAIQAKVTSLTVSTDGSCFTPLYKRARFEFRAAVELSWDEPLETKLACALAAMVDPSARDDVTRMLQGSQHKRGSLVVTGSGSQTARGLTSCRSFRRVLGAGIAQRLEHELRGFIARN
jgi:hypothetical protein